MNLYESQFLEVHDQVVPQGKIRTLLIASTPRCGSHMIGHAMAKTGCLGVPYEYCNPANMARWMRRLETDTPDATLRALIARRTTGNGIFGIKAHYEHGAVFGTTDALVEALPNPCVVHLRRADVLRQAISFAVARQTGVWIDRQEATSSDANYDRDLIADCLDEIAVQNALWTSLFARHRIKPLEITYEDAVRNISKAVTSTAIFAGAITPDQQLTVEAATKPQSLGSRTEEWVARYSAERRSLAPKAPLFRRIGRRAARAVLNGGAP